MRRRDTQQPKMAADRIGNIVRGEMGIMPLGDPGVGMAELGRGHRHPSARQPGAIGIAQIMEGHRRVELRCLQGLLDYYCWCKEGQVARARRVRTSAGECWPALVS